MSDRGTIIKTRTTIVEVKQVPDNLREKGNVTLLQIHINFYRSENGTRGMKAVNYYRLQLLNGLVIMAGRDRRARQDAAGWLPLLCFQRAPLPLWSPASGR